MKKIAITLIILLPTLCFSQIDLSKAKVTYGAENEKLPKIGDTIREYDESSEIIKSIKFCDSTVFTIIEFGSSGHKIKATVFPLGNLKFKTLTKFHENGNIILIANYDMGIVTGDFKKLFDTGKLMETGVYKKMKKVGEWKYYNENGELIKSETYNDGKLVEN
jgi:antitoxin component YwqK of YwqJK toxin-antitoxin module